MKLPRWLMNRSGAVPLDDVVAAIAVVTMAQAEDPTITAVYALEALDKIAGIGDGAEYEARMAKAVERHRRALTNEIHHVVSTSAVREDFDGTTAERIVELVMPIRRVPPVKIR